MRGKYLNVFGECAERIYVYMEKTQKGSWHILQYAKRYRSVNISVNNNTNLKKKFICTYYTIWDGLSKKTSHCPFNREKYKNIFLPKQGHLKNVKTYRDPYLGLDL
jgi:hypothetical protein